MKKWNISVVFFTGLLSACNTVNVPIENAESVTISNPTSVQTPKPTPVKVSSGKTQSSFKYLSKLTLANGPCPERDPSSYGLLMKQRTTIADNNIICYYN